MAVTVGKPATNHRRSSVLSARRPRPRPGLEVRKARSGNTLRGSLGLKNLRGAAKKRSASAIAGLSRTPHGLPRWSKARKSTLRRS